MEQNYISENCDVPTKHDYCSIPLHLKKVLDNSKSTDLKSQYEKSFSLKEGNRYINRKQFERYSTYINIKNEFKRRKKKQNIIIRLG